MAIWCGLSLIACEMMKVHVQLELRSLVGNKVIIVGKLFNLNSQLLKCAKNNGIPTISYLPTQPSSIQKLWKLAWRFWIVDWQFKTLWHRLVAFIPVTVTVVMGWRAVSMDLWKTHRWNCVASINYDTSQWEAQKVPPCIWPQSVLKIPPLSLSLWENTKHNQRD